MNIPLSQNEQFPQTRLRRTRQAPWVRELLTEHRLHPAELIWPCFVQEGTTADTPIPAMPGVSRLSIDLLVHRAKLAHSLGIQAMALFPVTVGGLKDELGREALNPENLVCRAIAAVKNALPEMGIIADVALDPYTSHGHDGIVVDGQVDNDRTLEILCKQAFILARAGADIVAPSDMMDGRVGAIRRTLDQNGHSQTMILAYSVKYASSLYGPFRQAVDSATYLGKADKRGYQMNPANAVEALREAAMDISEGADMLMVKPAGLYLDIIQRLSSSCPLPVLAYQVSGEYSMIHAAGAQGYLDAGSVIMESLIAFKRAGARAILTYAALDVAQEFQS